MKTITPIQKQLVLLKREFWEQRIIFLIVPVCCVIFAALAWGTATVRAWLGNYNPVSAFTYSIQRPDETAADAIIRFSEAPMELKQQVWEQFYSVPTTLLFLAFWSIMMYYYLVALYQPRKDRSILFWNSMPISNMQTVMSKLIAGFVLAQGVYLVCMLALQLVVMLVLAIYGMGFDVDVWGTFIAPARIFQRFFSFSAFCLINIFWCLPFYAWLLLVSAIAKSAPLAWASAPLVIATIPELIIFEGSDIFVKVVQHAMPRFAIQEGKPDTMMNTGFLAQSGMLMELMISAILGIILVAAAIRFNRSEDL
jgi:ABC-2 type transport system permease protein